MFYVYVVFFFGWLNAAGFRYDISNTHMKWMTDERRKKNVAMAWINGCLSLSHSLFLSHRPLNKILSLGCDTWRPPENDESRAKWVQLNGEQIIYYYFFSPVNIDNQPGAKVPNAQFLHEMEIFNS